MVVIDLLKSAMTYRDRKLYWVRMNAPLLISSVIKTRRKQRAKSRDFQQQSDRIFIVLPEFFSKMTKIDRKNHISSI